MAIGTTQFFALPEEFSAWMRELVMLMDLQLRRRDSMELLTPDELVQIVGFTRIYVLSHDSHNVEKFDAESLQDGAMITCPYVTGSNLVMAQLAPAWKSSTGELYRSLRAWMRSRLAHDVEVTNVKTGKSRRIREVRASTGAHAFFAHGGQLIQEGVANQRFRPLLNPSARLS